MKHTLGAIAVAAALAFAGGIASTSANAASSNGATKATSERQQTVSDTDISSHRRHWRRYGYVRPWRGAYPYRYSYYRPRPYYYRPYSYASYPPPYYYRPYRPAPIFSIGFGFGPRGFW
jgi:hypothetical protein